MRVRAATVFFSMSILVFASVARPATTPAAGKASGDLVVDGKVLALHFATAITGPDTFDKTKEATVVILTAKPLSDELIKSASSMDAVRHSVDQGLILKFRAEEGFHLTVRHPILDGQELQTSGPATFMKTIAVSGDTVSGTISPWMGDDDIMSHKLRYSIAFTAPIVRRFPLEKPIVLASNARKLGPGGGDPGKAYLKEKCTPPPVLPEDPKAMEALLRKEGLLKEMEAAAKKEGHTVTQSDIDEVAKQLRLIASMGALLVEKDCKVLGGAEDGHVAILQVEAIALGEMRARTDITLTKEDGVWKVKKEGTWTSVK